VTLRGRVGGGGTRYSHQINLKERGGRCGMERSLRAGRARKSVLNWKAASIAVINGRGMNEPAI